MQSVNVYEDFLNKNLPQAEGHAVDVCIFAVAAFVDVLFIHSENHFGRQGILHSRWHSVVW